MSKVEWKKLGDVANLVRGKVISKDYIRDNEGDYPVYSSQTANDGVMGCIDSYMFAGDYLTWTTDGAYAGTVFRRKGKFNITNVCGLIDINDECLNQDFLYYWLTLTAKSYVLEGMGNPKLMSNVASNIKIPILPLARQKEIVGILDTFTSSIENLKEQIALRRKQYEYYRDQLLDLEGKEGVEMKTLGLICSFIRGPFGGALKKEIFTEEGYVIYEQQHAIYGKWDFRYHISEEKFQEMKRFAVNAGDIIMSCSGTMGKTSIVPDDYERGIINQALLKLTTNNEVINRYIKLYMDSKWFQDGLKKQTAGGAIQNVASVSVLKNIKLPVPSISEQQRIVDILDKFEASIQNLEAQLAQREKQYEYYRNKLLTFE